MARPNAPWWWKARQCWACNLDGRRETAPRTIKEADRHAAWAWHAELLAARAPVPAAPHTFATLAAAYLADREQRGGADWQDVENRRAAASHLKRICATPLRGRLLGNTLAGQLTPAHYEAILEAWRRLGLAASTRQTMAALLKRVLGWAARPTGERDRLLPHSPFAGLPTPRAGPAPDRLATRADAARWLRWLRRRGASRWHARLQRVLIHTGARPRELATATWKDVNLDAGVLPSGHAYGTITLSRWKTAAATGKARRIILTPRIRRTFARMRGEGRAPGASLFLSGTGHAVTAHHMAQETRRLRDIAARDDREIVATGPSRICNYLWRHVAISTALMQGVDVATAAALFGTSPKMIMRTYAHLFTAHLASAAAVLQRGGRSAEKPRSPGGSPAGSGPAAGGAGPAAG